MDHIYAVNECLGNHLKMELAMTRIFSLLKEISILIQAPNNVEKKIFSNLSKYRHFKFCSDLNEKFMDLTAVAKVKSSPEMSCPQCHYFYPSYSTIIVVTFLQSVASCPLLQLSSTSV